MTLPGPLVGAITALDGRVALVVGAGTSVEPPTNLPASRECSLAAYEVLVRQGTLVAGECPHPDDLAEVADAVVRRTGSQNVLVQALPLNQLRTASPNRGHLLAALLLREEAVSTVVTLNFDIAMANALGRVGTGAAVSVVAGPGDHGQLGLRTVIFLHGNAYADAGRWTLTTAALQSGWQDAWIEAIAARVLSGPVTVFAGVGARVYALVESAGQLRRRIPAGRHLYNVDLAPIGDSDFFRSLGLPPEAYIPLGWCAFMDELAAVVLEIQTAELERTCEARGRVLGISHAGSSALCQQLKTIGALETAQIRARWLLTRSEYAPGHGRDPAFVADVLLAIGIIERSTGAEAAIRESGVVDFLRPGPVASVLVASGSGLQGAVAVEADLLVRGGHWKRHVPRPSYAVIAGVEGPDPEAVAAPPDLTRGERLNDIIDAGYQLKIITIHRLRQNPELAREIVG